jgi:hypothetical protein
LVLRLNVSTGENDNRQGKEDTFLYKKEAKYEIHPLSEKGSGFHTEAVAVVLSQ